MIDDNGVSVDAEITDKRDLSAVGGFCGVVLSNRQVVAEMIGGIDRILLIYVGSSISKICFDFGIAKLAKRVMPEYRRGLLLGDRANLVFVFFAQTLIHFDKDLFWARLARSHIV